jgi:hypothetical protein
VNFSDRPLSFFCPFVCPPVRLLTFHIFDFFSRTTGPISTRLGIKFVQMKSNILLQGDITAKMLKKRKKERKEKIIIIFKNLLQNQQANFNQT